MESAVDDAVGVLNRVPRDKLPRLLAHVLDALAAASSAHADVFSPDEKAQLCEMLALASPTDVDALVALVTRVFVDAAHFGVVDSDALRKRSCVSADALALVERAWRKKGRAVASEIAAKHPLDPAVVAAMPVLTETNWRLHVELGQSRVHGQTDPTAIFQLALQDPRNADHQVGDLSDGMREGVSLLYTQKRLHGGVSAARDGRGRTVPRRAPRALPAAQRGPSQA